MTEAVQNTSRVLMVAPVRFHSNHETLIDNFFQHRSEKQEYDTIQQWAKQEFANMHGKLERAGVEVMLYQELPDAENPDAIFPNNWFSTHHDNVFCLYPMRAPSRRRERRADIVGALKASYGGCLDLTSYEDTGQYLEGTGSLVLDHITRTAYASISPRTDPEIADHWATEMGFELVLFRSTDRNKKPVYHTNVVMAIGEKFAIVALEAIPDEAERNEVERKLLDSGRIVVEIYLRQVEQFCGNALEVIGRNGKHYLVLSETAANALEPSQLEVLESYCHLIVPRIPTIEWFGGGSVRCMMAELF